MYLSALLSLLVDYSKPGVVLKNLDPCQGMRDKALHPHWHFITFFISYTRIYIYIYIYIYIVNFCWGVQCWEAVYLHRSQCFVWFFLETDVFISPMSILKGAVNKTRGLWTLCAMLTSIYESENWIYTHCFYPDVSVAFGNIQRPDKV